MNDFYNLGQLYCNERQLWTNYMNNGYECLIIGAVVRSEYSTIRYLYLIISNVRKFVWSQKNGFEE